HARALRRRSIRRDRPGYPREHPRHGTQLDSREVQPRRIGRGRMDDRNAARRATSDAVPSRSQPERRSAAGGGTMRGHVRKRGKTWAVVSDENPGEGEKRRQRWKGGFRPKAEAEEALR